MTTQYEAIIEAFRVLGGIRNKHEIADWVNKRYGASWKDFGTVMADMVPVSIGGNKSSLIPIDFRVLQRVERGNYSLIHNVTQLPEPISEGTTIKSVKSRTDFHAEQLAQTNYIIYGPVEQQTIEVFSNKRLPYEPKGC